MEKDRTEQLRKIKEEILNFKKSPLYPERIKNNVFPVIGEGNHYAELMFIGEAPGKNEAITGRPFVGAAGKLLTEFLTSAGIKREDVYITNIVKDRPPLNRDPLPNEIDAYSGFLDRQIEVIQPKIIATLGRFSMDYIMIKFNLHDYLDSISKIHGKVFESETSYGKIKIVPQYHPAVAIYNNTMKETLKNDLKNLAAVLKT